MRKGIKRDNLGYGQRDIPAVTKVAITVIPTNICRR
jgi:hypothetical protein